MKAAAAAVSLTALGALAPVVTSLPWLRRTCRPRLAGAGSTRHVALTYDDGPDAVSTPHFLDLLARHDRRATFFLLGAHVAPHADLVRRMAAEGHELAVHGWDHRCLALRPSVGRLGEELLRTRELIEAVTGDPVRWYRPPYGVLTTEGVLAARSAGLQTVLWTTWGRDWSARATPESVVRLVGRDLAPGGTVLLHDTDRTSAPGSWRTTLGASEILLSDWAQQGLDVGPLRDHWPAEPAPAQR